MCRKIAFFGLRAEIILSSDKVSLDSRAGPFFGVCRNIGFSEKYSPLHTIALWVKASSGVKKGPKNVKSRPLFLIHQTHQVIFAALFELVMIHILHRKKLDDVGAEYLTKITANVQKR